MIVYRRLLHLFFRKLCEHWAITGPLRRINYRVTVILRAIWPGILNNTFWSVISGNTPFVPGVLSYLQYDVTNLQKNYTFLFGVVIHSAGCVSYCLIIYYRKAVNIRLWSIRKLTNVMNIYTYLLDLFYNVEPHIVHNWGGIKYHIQNLFIKDEAK